MRHLIRVMRRQDMTKKLIMTKTNTKTNTMGNTFREQIQRQRQKITTINTLRVPPKSDLSDL